ncbi:MAG TPA: cytochrome P450 [Solirubrobacteraceae bacterium]|nr:cytochrome P450 [Solirubrobacteraceae bacterium]
MKTQLPPGPRMPSVLQALGAWSRPIAVLERGRRRYGKRYTIRIVGQPPFVVLSDPQDLKEVLTAPPDVLHPGEGARVLEVLLGPNSVILLDEAPHLEQRKLMLPAFHGERMQNLAGLMRELCEEEVESWPLEQPIELHQRLQRLTLEIVLRAVFGLERGARLDELRDLLTQVLRFTEHPLSLLRPPSKRIEDLLALRGPLARTRAQLAQADRLIYELIEERRAADAEGADVLALLLAARHEDGSPMSPAELRDELMTALVAGHETTASQLAWAFADLARAPRVRARLMSELDAGEDEEYLTATINEVLRHRPVLPNAEPRLVKQPVTIGGFEYQPGVVLFVNAQLVHHDPEIYPEPNAFRPERFLESEGGRAPGTYTWLPFGGGRRRCLGASFALLEMRIVLRAVFERCDVEPAGGRPEVARRRSITVSPSRGANVILRARSHVPEATREDGRQKLAVAA